MIDDIYLSGEEAISRLETYRRSGTLQVSGMVGRHHGIHEQASIVRSKAYMRSEFGAATDEQGWDGTVGWKRDPQAGLRTLDDSDLIQIRGVAEVNGIVQIYREYGRAGFKSVKDERFGAARCHVLEVVDMPLRFYVDPVTHLIAGSRFSFTDPNSGAKIPVVTTISDYAEFGGVPMGNRLNIKVANGLVKLDITFDETEVDIELPDSMFEMPQAS